MAMTAAEHFEKAEALLNDAEKYFNDPKGALWVARAQAHLQAAQLLLNVEISRAEPGASPGTAAWRVGLGVVAEERKAA